MDALMTRIMEKARVDSTINRTLTGITGGFHEENTEFGVIRCTVIKASGSFNRMLKYKWSHNGVRVSAYRLSQIIHCKRGIRSENEKERQSEELCY